MVSLKKIKLCILLSTNILFSQNKEKHSPFFSQIKESSEKYTNDFIFKKAQHFFLQKKWDSTLHYSLILVNKKQKSEEIGNFCYFFRGYSFKRKKIFNEAKKELKKITKRFVFFDRIDMYLGEIALEEEDFIKSINYFRSFQKSKDYNDNESMQGNIYQNIGINYLHLKEYENADTHLKQSSQILEKKKDTIKLIRLYGNIASLYYEQYKDDIAIPYYQKAYALSKNIKNFDVKRRVALNMSVVEENKKNYKKALAYNIEYHKWKDSVRAEAKQLITMQREKEEVVKQKQNEVNVLQAENRAKTAERNRIFYAAIILFLLLSTITYFFRKNIKSKKIIVNQNEQLDALNATKNKLFSIVSHDLRSSVNTLKISNKKLINTLETENLPQVHQLLQQNSAIVGSAYNLLDNLLNWALLQTKQSYFEIKETHLFFTVEHVVYNYIPLMKEKQILFKNTVSKADKVLADQESLKIVLRNLLDNAIKFSRENDQIKIYTQSTKNNFLEIIIEDSGIGMNEQIVEKLQLPSIYIDEIKNKKIIGSGLGLQLCKSMIKKNKGTLSIESELEKGTKMIVSLLKPLSNE